VASEVLSTYRRFIEGQNAHDPSAVSNVVLQTREFVLAQPGGDSTWGYKEAMDAFASAWRGTWKMQPQFTEVRIAAIAPNAAVLVSPLMLTTGAPGGKDSTALVRWSGVFVKTDAGWRIASIFITPYSSWHGTGAQ
jgi:ketosteroid isomerase-like protein